MSEFKNCWIITEGMAGTENQCLGVSDALGITPHIKRISLRAPWCWLSPYFGLECAITFKGDALEPPWPDLLITSGRKSIAAARYIHKQTKGRVFICHLQDPRIKSAVFDLIAVPFHDKLRGENVIVTDGAPNRITSAKLDQASQDAPPLLNALPQPRIAVLIGGNSKTHLMSAQHTSDIIKTLRRYADEGRGIMVTASRRTGEANMKALQEGLKHDNIYFWDGSGDNPYFTFLALAKSIIVTEDSVSMISDALSTGKPTYLAALEGDSPKFKRFYDNLTRHNKVKYLTADTTLPSYSYAPLQDAQKIAKAIKDRFEYF